MSADDIEALPPPYQESIRQLHRTVEAAIATIEALRAENEQLSERIEALERRPDVPDDATVLTFDDPPEALREQIQDFLTIIDQYLGTGDGHAEEPWSPHMLSPSSPHTDAS